MNIKTKKRIKISLLSAFGIVFLLFALLIVHVVIMVKKGGTHNAGIQLARVDFKQNLDSAQALAVQEKFRSEKGVKSTYYNYKDNILIYAFDDRQNNSQAIYNAAVKSSTLHSTRYIVAAADMNKGCPAMNANSFYGKLSSFVYNIVY